VPDNDEHPTVDVVDEGFRPDAPASDADAGVAVDVKDLTITLDADDDDDRAITSFLTGEAAMGSLRERPWTRFLSMSAYALRDAVRGIRRRPGLAASAALTVSLCALLAGGAAIARAGVDATMARWADGVEFVVYLQPGATSADIDRVGDELRQADGVRDVTPVSQEQAFEEYQRLYSDEETMVEAVTPDLLPPSFRVAPEDADPGLIQRITRPLASDPDVYQVVTADDAVQDVRDLSGAVSGFGTWLAVVLGVVGIVLSATMIRSSIASRQREIDMMRSFGAGRSYIAAPVAVEGVLIGIVGAGVAAIGLAFAMARASGSDSSVVSSLLPPTSEARTVVLVVFLVTVLVCTAVSVLTTANALRKAR
jgi:cell division transport system permease protein